MTALILTQLLYKKPDLTMILNGALAGLVSITAEPLTPTLISSIDDRSALLQVVTQYSLGDNATFLGSLNVPLGGGVGKIVRFGKLPVNFQTQAFYNVEKPQNGADCTLRLQAQLMFPK